MEFEWDEAKRLQNLAKHNLDFYRVDEFFEGAHIAWESRVNSQEPRSGATGYLDGVCVTVITTMRGDVVRIISMRRARRDERRRYQAVFGH